MWAASLKQSYKADVSLWQTGRDVNYYWRFRESGVAKLAECLADCVIPHSRTDVSREFRIGHIHKETICGNMFRQGM
jgi:hypothetical protein